MAPGQSEIHWRGARPPTAGELEALRALPAGRYAVRPAKLASRRVNPDARYYFTVAFRDARHLDLGTFPTKRAALAAARSWAKTTGPFSVWRVNRYTKETTRLASENPPAELEGAARAANPRRGWFGRLRRKVRKKLRRRKVARHRAPPVRRRRRKSGQLGSLDSILADLAGGEGSFLKEGKELDRYLAPDAHDAVRAVWKDGGSLAELRAAARTPASPGRRAPTVAQTHAIARLPNPGRWPEGSRVQSLIFARPAFTRAKAAAWAKSHGYRSRLEETAESYRARQEASGRFSEFRTAALGRSGVVAVLGRPNPRRSRGASEAVKTKRALERARREEQRRIVRVAIAGGRAGVKTARARARLTSARVRAACKASRGRARARARALRDQARELAPRARAECATRKATAGVLGIAGVERAKGELADTRRVYARKPRAPLVRSTAKERRQESDDEVERDLAPELVPIWRKVKRQIRATPGLRSRTEAFLEWVEENADDVVARQAEEYAGPAFARALEREEREHYARQVA